MPQFSKELSLGRLVKGLGIEGQGSHTNRHLFSLMKACAVRKTFEQFHDASFIEIQQFPAANRRFLPRPSAASHAASSRVKSLRTLSDG